MLRDVLPWQGSRGVGMLSVSIVIAVMVGVLIAATPNPRVPFALAALPLIGVLLLGPRWLRTGMLVGAIGGLVVLGRDFAYLHVGPIYIMDAVLIVYLMGSARALVDIAQHHSYTSWVVGGILASTAFHIATSGATGVVLRQAVLGGYALWVIVGIVAAKDHSFVPRVARTIWWGAIPAAGLLALSSVDPSNPLLHALTPGLIPVASSLYIGFALLLTLFAPTVAPNGSWVKLVSLAEAITLILGEVRSAWVAIAAASVIVVFVCRVSPRAGVRLVFYPLIGFAIILLAALMFAPGKVNAIRSEASSIVSYSGSSASDANARWRLNNWRYAEGMIGRHPFTGVGFGGPEVPSTVCLTACNKPVPGDPTVVVGGADLHNSILAIGLRLGLPTLALVLLYEFMLIRRAGWLSSQSADEFSTWLLASQLLTGVTALTAVVLEGPYMGIFFWFLGGLLLGYDARGEPVQPRSPAAIKAPRFDLVVAIDDAPGRAGRHGRA
jgi:hypothetical protein